MDFVRKHWKAIGALLGGLIGLLASMGLLTAEQATEINQSLLTLVGSLLGAYAAPKNDYEGTSNG